MVMWGRMARVAEFGCGRWKESTLLGSGVQTENCSCEAEARGKLKQ